MHTYICWYEHTMYVCMSEYSRVRHGTWHSMVWYDKVSCVRICVSTYLCICIPIEITSISGPTLSGRFCCMESHMSACRRRSHHITWAISRRKRTQRHTVTHRDNSSPGSVSGIRHQAEPSQKNGAMYNKAMFQDYRTLYQTRPSACILKA